MAATTTGKHKIVAMILLLVLGPASPIFYATRGQDERAESDTAIRKGLRLSAELRTPVFTPDSSMAVKLRLQNTSKSPIYLHKEIGRGPGGFYVTIFDAQNSRRADLQRRPALRKTNSLQGAVVIVLQLKEEGRILFGNFE
jgi:hypothetical protein